MPWSWVDTEYSIHRVQHTPSTAYTEYSIHRVQHPPKIICLPFFLIITNWPLNVPAAPSVASLYDRPPSASSPYELKGKVTLSSSHICELTNWCIDSQHPALCPSTASKYLSNIAQSRPPKCITKLHRLLPPSSHDHGLQVLFQSCSPTATMCISKLAWLQPASSHNRGLQMQLKTSSITISESIPKFTQSRPSSVSPNTLD